MVTNPCIEKLELWWGRQTYNKQFLPPPQTGIASETVVGAGGEEHSTTGLESLLGQLTILDVKEKQGLVKHRAEGRAVRVEGTARAKALCWEESWQKVWSEVSKEEGVQDEAADVGCREKSAGGDHRSA